MGGKGKEKVQYGERLSGVLKSRTSLGGKGKEKVQYEERRLRVLKSQVQYLEATALGVGVWDAMVMEGGRRFVATRNKKEDEARIFQEKREKMRLITSQPRRKV